MGAVLANRFELIAHLGSGGAGSVYLARDGQLDEQVAVKLLHQYRGGSDALEHLRHEVKLARRVTSTNVARIHDLVEDAGGWFLTMEFIDGVPLADMIAGDGRLPLARVIELLTSICNGLEAVHRAGVVHGDVKPANVMVARDGRVVLSDFGIARFIDSHTDTREVVGTPAYMAPEQVTGADLDHRADLYALGVVAFELLTGDLPFSGRNAIEVASARLIREPPDLRDRCPEIGDSMAATIAAMLARDPAARPESAAAVRAALTAAPPDVRSTASVDVVDLYLKAQWLYRQFNRADDAVELFERARRQVPDSAVVHAGYAVAVSRKWMKVGVDREGLAARARQAADRAMALGPHLGESQLARGAIELHSGDVVLAARAFREAIIRAPGLADAHAITCTMLLEIDRLAEAERRLEIAERLDPTLGRLRCQLTRARALRGDWSGAERLLLRAAEPGSLELMVAVRLSAYRGDHRALARLGGVAESWSGDLDASSIFTGLAAAFTGKLERERIYAMLTTSADGVSRRRLGVMAQMRAELAAFHGDGELALEALEISDREGRLIDSLWIDGCPLLDPLRGSERFAAVAARVRDRAAAVARAFGLD